LDKKYVQGMYDKYDIYADVDSFAIRKLLRDSPAMAVSNALALYYGQPSAAYDSRFGFFHSTELASADVAYSIAQFAHISAEFVHWDDTVRKCDGKNVLTECIPLLPVWAESYMAPRFISDVSCFDQEERGLATCPVPAPLVEAAPSTTFTVVRTGSTTPESPLRVEPYESVTATWSRSGQALNCRAYHQKPSGVFGWPWSGDLGKDGGSISFGLAEPGVHTLTLDCYSLNNIAMTRKVTQVEVLPPLDLAFVIDTTGSMWDDITNVETGAGQIVDAIFARSHESRVAVADYRDFPVSPYGTTGDYPFRAAKPFSPWLLADAVRSSLQSLSIGNGLDWQESVYSGLMGAIQAKTDSQGARLGFWRSSARKVIILIGDAPPHDPEPFTNYRLIDVLTAAAAGGNQGLPATAPLVAKAQDAVSEPIHIYSIAVGGDLTARNFFRLLSEGSGGKLFLAANAADVVPAILGVIADTKPTTNRPPDVSHATPSLTQLWPPNHQMVAVGIENVLDPDGDSVTIRIVGVTSDEPVRSSQGDKFVPDAAGLGTPKALLRAERNGPASSRVYRISFEASDGKGGVATGHVLVCVPHDQGVNTACTDDGQTFDATAQ
jgi:hypothetical protein